MVEVAFTFTAKPFAHTVETSPTFAIVVDGDKVREQTIEVDGSQEPKRVLMDIPSGTVEVRPTQPMGNYTVEAEWDDRGESGKVGQDTGATEPNSVLRFTIGSRDATLTDVAFS